MNSSTLAIGVVAVMVTFNTTVTAQRTSSATQTVTFGVHRASPSVLRGLALAQSDVISSDGSQANALQNMNPGRPLKVTMNILSVPTGYDRLESSENPSSRPSVHKTVGSESVPGSVDTRLYAGYDESARVVTISE